ncbi:unnamed protein product [Bathycoccus prasinos]
MNYQERSGFEPYDMSWNDDDSTPRTDLGDLLNPTGEAYEMPESQSPTPIDTPDEPGDTEDEHDVPHPTQESDLKKDIHHNFSQVSNLASMLEGVESTTESVAQHKYSRLAQSSYDYFNSKGNADLVNKNLKNPKYSHINDLNGFELDKELSTLDDAVLHNKLTGETVISFRGTTSNIKETKAFLKDWEVNSKIMFNPKSVENTRRMKNAFSNTENVISKYGKDNVKVVGHSQGGYVSSSVAQKLDLEGHHYNPAISVRQINQNKKGMFFKNTTEQNIYKTHTDFASPLAYDRHIQKNFNVNTVNYNPEITERSPFVSTHSLEQFAPTVEEELGKGMVRCERNTLVSSFKNSLGPAVNVGAQAYSAGKDFQQDIKEGGGVAVETAKIGLDAAKNAEEYVVDNMIMDADHSHHDDLRVDDELVVQNLKLPTNATVTGLTVSHISGLSDSLVDAGLTAKVDATTYDVGIALKADITKANQTDVDTSLALKADLSALNTTNTTLTEKLNISDANTALALKVDTADFNTLTATVNTKAPQASLDTTNNNLGALTTSVASLTTAVNSEALIQNTNSDVIIPQRGIPYPPKNISIPGAVRGGDYISQTAWSDSWAISETDFTNVSGLKRKVYGVGNYQMSGIATNSSIQFVVLSLPYSVVATGIEAVRRADELAITSSTYQSWNVYAWDETNSSWVELNMDTSVFETTGNPAYYPTQFRQITGNTLNSNKYRFPTGGDSAAKYFDGFRIYSKDESPPAIPLGDDRTTPDPDPTPDPVAFTTSWSTNGGIVEANLTVLATLDENKVGDWDLQRDEGTTYESDYGTYDYKLLLSKWTTTSTSNPNIPPESYWVDTVIATHQQIFVRPEPTFTTSWTKSGLTINADLSSITGAHPEFYAYLTRDDGTTLATHEFQTGQTTTSLTFTETEYGSYNYQLKLGTVVKSSHTETYVRPTPTYTASFSTNELTLTVGITSITYAHNSFAITLERDDGTVLQTHTLADGETSFNFTQTESLYATFNYVVKINGTQTDTYSATYTPPPTPTFEIAVTNDDLAITATLTNIVNPDPYYTLMIHDATDAHLDGHTFATTDTTVVLTWTETSYGEKTYTKLLNGASIGTETITLTDPNTPTVIEPQTLPSLDNTSLFHAYIYTWRQSTATHEVYDIKWNDGSDLWWSDTNGAAYYHAIAVNKATNTWEDYGPSHPFEEPVENADGTILITDGSIQNIYKFTKPTTASWISTPPSTLKWNFSDKHDGTAEGFSVHDDQTHPCYVEKASDGTWSLTLTGVLANRQDQSAGNNWDYIETAGGTVYLKYKSWDTDGYWSGPYTRAEWSSSIGSETIRIYEHSSYSEQYNNGIYLIQESSSSTPPPTQITDLFASHASGGEYGPAGVYTVIHSSSTPTLFVWQLGNSAWGGLLADHTISYDTTTKIWADVGSGNPYYVCDGSTWADTTASSANQQTLSFWQNSTYVVFELTNPYYEAPAYRTGTSQGFAFTSGTWKGYGYTAVVDDEANSSSGKLVNGVRQWEWDMPDIGGGRLYSGANNWIYFVPGTAEDNGTWYHSSTSTGGTAGTRNGRVISIGTSATFDETNAFVSGLVPYGDIP